MTTDDVTASGEPSTLRIGEVAKATGLTTRTLRYWEQLGLLSPDSHRESGERLYT
jgi:DNA-binding transcriptional MerR regulator